jgi:hypothetical protein
MIWLTVFMAGGLLVDGFATVILSGFPRLFYLFREFWNRLNCIIFLRNKICIMEKFLVVEYFVAIVQSIYAMKINALAQKIIVKKENVVFINVA